ncbi:hypothetical protein B7463_g4375, partial [Scytalidium lignicola]
MIRLRQQVLDQQRTRESQHVNGRNSLRKVIRHINQSSHLLGIAIADFITDGFVDETDRVARSYGMTRGSDQLRLSTHAEDTRERNSNTKSNSEPPPPSLFSLQTPVNGGEALSPSAAVSFNNPPSIFGLPLAANVYNFSEVPSPCNIQHLPTDVTSSSIFPDQISFNSYISSRNHLSSLGSEQPERQHVEEDDYNSYLLTAKPLLTAATVADPIAELHPREANLLKFFTQTWGPIFDCLDADATFSKSVLHIALTSFRPLLYAMLAISALQLSRVSNYPSAAAEYYRSQCSKAIMPILLSHNTQGGRGEEALFATYVMLRSYEQMTEDIKETGTLFTASLAISAGPSRSPSEVAVGRAAFWIHLRQDIHIALLLQCYIRTDYCPCLSREEMLADLDKTLSSPSAIDCACANRMANVSAIYFNDEIEQRETIRLLQMAESMTGNPATKTRARRLPTQKVSAMQLDSEEAILAGSLPPYEIRGRASSRPGLQMRSPMGVISSWVEWGSNIITCECFPTVCTACCIKGVFSVTAQESARAASQIFTLFRAGFPKGMAEEKMSEFEHASKATHHEEHSVIDTEDVYNPASEDLQVIGRLTVEQVIERASKLAEDCGLADKQEVLIRGAKLAHRPREFYTSATAPEKQALQDEVRQRFKQPLAVWWVSVVNAMAATVQGMDETVVSGAQLYFLKYFGLENDVVMTGFVNASPYLMCATVGCWLAIPFNSWFGRRGTIFCFSIVSVAASFWEAAAHSWQVFLGGRLLLGISIGANSATVAMYTAECSPVPIRGGLVMFWELFVAFGIMLGYLMGVAFLKVEYPLNWRLMMGSTFVAPLFVIALVFFGPESPRYLVSKRRYKKAFQSLVRLRANELQASRDLYCIYEAVKLEEHLRTGRTFFSDIRDIMTYYTGQVFVDTGASSETAIYASVGAGALLWLGAIPAVRYIDKWGRRPLLIGSLILMAGCTLFTGFSFLAPNQHERLALVAVGIYLYELVYAPGQGTIPFVYASESFPLYMRSLGMSFATATTWVFSFSLTLAWPSQLASMTPTGAFCFYSAWCVVGTVVVFFFIPETRGLSLEELDAIFNVPMALHANNKWHLLQFWLKLRPKPPVSIMSLAKEQFAQFQSEESSNTPSDKEA